MACNEDDFFNIFYLILENSPKKILALISQKSCFYFLIINNKDKTLRAVIGQNTRSIRVNIEKACFIVLATLPLYDKANEEA